MYASKSIDLTEGSLEVNEMIEFAPLTKHREFIPTLAEWHQREWGYLNPMKTVASRVEEFEAHLSEDLIPSTIVAMEDDELLGSASLVESDLDSRPEIGPWLASVYVCPQHRRRGIGGQLVRSIDELAHDSEEFDALHLYTTDREDFYLHLGWSVAERTTHNGVAIIIMSLSVTRF